MFSNYLKVAFRNILRHKGYSFINIVGLAIGMASCYLIMVWVQNELSFDSYHERADRIYRVAVNAHLGTPISAPVTSGPVAPAMVRDYPEIVNAARVGFLSETTVEYRDMRFKEENVGYADNSLFDIFTIPFVKGDPKSALTTAYTVVITQDMATKYFGSEDPLGKMLRIGDEHDYAVTGVVENIPPNSHFKFDILRSFETLVNENSETIEEWMSFSYGAYILLDENADYHQLESKFPSFVEANYGAVLSSFGGTLEFFLQPIESIHLYSSLDLDSEASGNIMYVYLFSGIAFFILVIACFNFINLSTARSVVRAREVGMRKAFGAVRGKLIGQFLGEAILQCMMSLVLAIILMELGLSLLHSLAGIELSAHLWKTIWFMPSLAGSAVLVGLAAGSYPAFYLSSFEPVKILRGKLGTGSSSSKFRDVLVTTQFVISVVLIIGTITVYSQLRYMKNKNLGFDKEQVVVLPSPTDDLRRFLSPLRSELASVPGVLDVAASSMIPGRGINKSLFFPEGFSERHPQRMDEIAIDEHFIPTMGIELVAGRNFEAELASDTLESVIINEAAAVQFGWEEPIGKKFFERELSDNQPPAVSSRTVVGVVRDFHLSSLHKKIEPLFISNQPSDLDEILIRVTPVDIGRTMDLIEDKWAEIFPQRSFEYYFLDETFDSMYRAEERMGTLGVTFSLLAIFVACLGLFGMSAYTAEQRTKEIGIRKVLGASSPGIVGMLSKNFVLILVIANVIAWPIGYYSLNRWLENFAYRVDIGALTFLLAGFGALAVALTTVCYQAIKAARSNPVEALKYE